MGEVGRALGGGGAPNRPPASLHLQLPWRMKFYFVLVKNLLLTFHPLYVSSASVPAFLITGVNCGFFRWGPRLAAGPRLALQPQLAPPCLSSAPQAISRGTRPPPTVGTPEVPAEAFWGLFPTAHSASHQPGPSRLSLHFASSWITFRSRGWACGSSTHVLGRRPAWP